MKYKIVFAKYPDNGYYVKKSLLGIFWLNAVYYEWSRRPYPFETLEKALDAIERLKKGGKTVREYAQIKNRRQE